MLSTLSRMGLCSQQMLGTHLIVYLSKCTNGSSSKQLLWLSWRLHVHQGHRLRGLKHAVIQGAYVLGRLPSPMLQARALLSGLERPVAHGKLKPGQMAQSESWWSGKWKNQRGLGSNFNANSLFTVSVSYTPYICNMGAIMQVYLDR